MDDLKQKLKKIAERIDALSVRERGIIFVTVLAALFFVASKIVYQPLSTEQLKLEQSLKAKRDKLGDIDRQINTLVSGGNEVDAQNRAKIASLTQKLAELESQMDRMTSGVVTPKEMAKLVESVLTRSRNLELVRLEALPPMPVGDDGRVVNADAAAPASTASSVEGVVYRHGMRVELKGKYFDIVEYLKALEGLQWKVFWGEVTLETDKYPISKVSLVIYTLSRYPNWIGV
jgi:MSHA biogenesis protein MshJ